MKKVILNDKVLLKFVKEESAIIRISNVDETKPFYRGEVVGVGNLVNSLVKVGDIAATGFYHGIDWVEGDDNFKLIAEKDLYFIEDKV